MRRIPTDNGRGDFQECLFFPGISDFKRSAHAGFAGVPAAALRLDLPLQLHLACPSAQILNRRPRISSLQELVSVSTFCF